MSIADEIRELQKLKKSGALSDQEFDQAKKKLLYDTATPARNPLRGHQADDSLGQAANRFVSFQIVMAIVGIIIFFIMLFGVILPKFNSGPSFPTFP